MIYSYIYGINFLLMKRLFPILLLGLFLAQSASLFSQEKYDYLQKAGLNAAIFRGPEAVKYQFRYQGTPYAYTESFMAGSIVYNGVKYERVELNLNAHRDELHLRIPSSGIVLELDRNAVEEFVIGSRKYVALTAENAVDGLPEGYYQVLFEGNDILYKKNIRTFHERLQTSGGGAYRYFDQSDKYFIVKDGVVFPVVRNRDFARIYKEGKKAVRGYVKHNMGRFTDMERDQVFMSIMEFADKNR